MTRNFLKMSRMQRNTMSVLSTKVPSLINVSNATIRGQSMKTMRSFNLNPTTPGDSKSLKVEPGCSMHLAMIEDPTFPWTVHRPI